MISGTIRDHQAPRRYNRPLPSSLVRRSDMRFYCPVSRAHYDVAISPFTRQTANNARHENKITHLRVFGTLPRIPIESRSTGQTRVSMCAQAHKQTASEDRFEMPT